MGEKITYSYYTSAQVSQNTFYRLPRALYEKEYFKILSNDAKTLYALMLDQMSLSLAHGWLDEEGRVYINYSIESIMETKRILWAIVDKDNLDEIKEKVLQLINAKR